MENRDEGVDYIWPFLIISEGEKNNPTLDEANNRDPSVRPLSENRLSSPSQFRQHSEEHSLQTGPGKEAGVFSGWGPAASRPGQGPGGR